ncbi:MAG: hypothetical protein FYV88_1140, partial [Bacteroidetes bacterium]|nr:hypothetical protein [Bacteroidota bacterium]
PVLPVSFHPLLNDKLTITLAKQDYLSGFE